MLTVCTIVAPRTLAQARVMAASVATHHPEARVLAAVSAAAKLRDEEPFTVVDHRVASTIPDLLAHALADADADAAVYLDPAVWVRAALEPVLSSAQQSGIALVPRLAELPDDGQRPDHADLLAAGTITPDLVAVTAGEPAQTFLRWWSEHLEEARARDEPVTAGGRWLELGRQRFPAAATVDDAGCAVSYWNLHERVLSREDGEIHAAGRLLRSLHFAGFRADRPYWLNEDATRVRVIDDPVLAELCGEYAEHVRDAGWSPPRRQLARDERLGNGQLVDHFVKELWEHALEADEDFGDPMEEPAAEAFVSWMREPGELGARAGVNRYLEAVYLHRPDLQHEFPAPDGADGDRLVAWAWSQSGREVLADLVPIPPGEPLPPNRARLGVNVIGYLGETLGLAEAARGYVTALSAAGVPVTTTALSTDLPIEDAQRGIPRYGSGRWRDIRSDQDPAFNLACLNGDHLADLIRARGEGVLEGRPTIGQWGWETDVLPPSWSEAFGLVNEVWVYSSFMAENLGRLLPVPVVVVPPALVAPEPTDGELAISFDDRFTFVFMLDFFSTLERKNPLGLIDAFTRAFAPGEGPRLLIKTINAAFRQPAADELRLRAGGRPDIEFVDGYLEPGQKAELLARAGCYVSLHRSEGFGLPLAEAMALGTPVIATGYSGNTDFTSPFNSYLVDWSPTRVGPGSGVYPAHGRWAEPDLDHAATMMRAVWEDEAERERRALRAREDIERLYAPEVVGQIARSRLELLLDAPAQPAAFESGGEEELDRLEHALAFDLRTGTKSASSRPTDMLRRGVLRLILPFTFHEREVDRAVLAALRRLRAQFEGERERHRRDRRRLGRLEAAVHRAQASTEDDLGPSDR